MTYNVARGAPRLAALTATLLGAALLAVACAPMQTTPSPPPTAPSADTARAPAAPPAVKPPTPAPADAARSANAASTQRGRISLYGKEFDGKKTASGDIFDADGLTMAHRTLPFGTRVRVTNLENNRTVEVTVTDRGPAVPGRIADLSRGAATRIGMVTDGVVEALLEVLPGSR